MSAIRLGLRENLAQFSLLVVVNAFVGAMIGMERSILPAIGEQDFHLAARTAVLSFIVVFGVTKALTNYLAGRLSDRFGRKHVLVAGWLIATPVPFLLMWAPSFAGFGIGAALLGVGTAMVYPTLLAAIGDVAHPSWRASSVGVYRALARPWLCDRGAARRHHGRRAGPSGGDVVHRRAHGRIRARGGAAHVRDAAKAAARVYRRRLLPRGTRRGFSPACRLRRGADCRLRPNAPWQFIAGVAARKAW